MRVIDTVGEAHNQPTWPTGDRHAVTDREGTSRCVHAPHGALSLSVPPHTVAAGAEK